MFATDKDILINMTQNSPFNLPKLCELKNKNIFQYLSVCKNQNLVESNIFILFLRLVSLHCQPSDNFFVSFLPSFVLRNYKAIKINGKPNVEIDFCQCLVMSNVRNYIKLGKKS